MSQLLLAQTEEAVASLKSFSGFQHIDLPRLFADEILGERDSLLPFPNGISVQACFVVPLPPAETAAKLRSWDPTRHESLKMFGLYPVKTPGDPADFQPLSLKSDKSALHWLSVKTLAAVSGKTALHFSHSEQRQLAGRLKKGSDAVEVAEAWKLILLGRVAAFQAKGLDGAAPYEATGEDISPAFQLRSLFKERPRLVAEFEGLLTGSGVYGGEPSRSLVPHCYWDLFDAGGHGALSLGAIYECAAGDRRQLLDLEYYVSNGYYASATLYEIWPVQAGGKSGSLVWRGDLFAVPMIGFIRSIERIACGSIMLGDVKKSIQCFREDLAAGR